MLLLHVTGSDNANTDDWYEVDTNISGLKHIERELFDVER